MKLRPTKFIVRENTASLRQHASRVKSDTRSNIAHFAEERPEAQPTSSRNAPSVKVPENPLHVASHDQATGRDARDGRHLLDVHEVAELLHVPVGLRTHAQTFFRTAARLPAWEILALPQG
jgi:hypothetical protein